VSNGPDNNDQDLQLTYLFEWIYPDIDEGTTAHDEVIEKTGTVCLPQSQDVVVIDWLNRWH
jgi:hypothetical protein